MNTERITQILANVSALVKYQLAPADETREDSKMMLSFFVGNKTHLYKVPGTKQKVSMPHEITRRGFNIIMDKLEVSYLDSLEEVPASYSHKDILSTVKDSTIIRWTEEGIPNLSSFLMTEHNITKDELPFAFRAVLATMSDKCAELSAAVSLADPDRTAKNKILTSLPYEKVKENIPAARIKAKENLEAEIKNLQETLAKMDTIPSEDILKLGEEKFKANGTDEDGFLKLKGKKTEAPKAEAETANV